MSGQTAGKPQSVKQLNSKPKRKRVFDGEFFNYWHFVKVLSEEQRELLASTLSKEEQQELIASYKKGGWRSLFMRNACDQVLDSIKRQYGVNWLLIKSKILDGKPQLIQKPFWKYLNDCFNGIEWDDISYIFDGLIAYDFDAEYVKVCLFVAPPLIDEEQPNSNDTKGV